MISYIMIIGQSLKIKNLHNMMTMKSFYFSFFLILLFPLPKTHIFLLCVYFVLSSLHQVHYSFYVLKNCLELLSNPSSFIKLSSAILTQDFSLSLRPTTLKIFIMNPEKSMIYAVPTQFMNTYQFSQAHFKDPFSCFCFYIAKSI